MNRGPILIVVNPVAGKGRAVRLAGQVAEQIRRQGGCAEVARTAGRLSAQQIATAACDDHARRPACVVACGGDGTVQEVAHALADWKSRLAEPCPSLCVAPVGRCNDFARVLGMPRGPEEIARIAVGGVAVPLDLGRVNGRHFCTVATLGVDAQVSRYVDRMRLPLRGTPAYVYGAIRVLLRYRPSEVRIEGDFGVIDRPVFLASSANTSTYGGAIPIVPDADPTDGFLDLCVIDAVSRLRAFAMLPIVMAGRHVHRLGVGFIRTRRLIIETPDPAELWADGEPVGRTPVTVEAVPAAVTVQVPPDSPLAGPH